MQHEYFQDKDYDDLKESTEANQRLLLQLETAHAEIERLTDVIKVAHKELKAGMDGAAYLTLTAALNGETDDSLQAVDSA